jgi:hypothetical protein
MYNLRNAQNGTDRDDEARIGSRIVDNRRGVTRSRSTGWRCQATRSASGRPGRIWRPTSPGSNPETRDCQCKARALLREPGDGRFAKHND